MEKKEIHLVFSHIGTHEGEARHQYAKVVFLDYCPFLVSSRVRKDQLTVPLWFGTEQAAMAYVEKASSDTERVFYLIQEFSYHSETIKDEAKIIFSCKSDTWPVLAEGKTERSPGVWADVRSFFVCDYDAALNYVRRFNEDAAAAFNVGRGQ